jgi:hypothetical protein
MSLSSCHVSQQQQLPHLDPPARQQASAPDNMCTPSSRSSPSYPSLNPQQQPSNVVSSTRPALVLPCDLRGCPLSGGRATPLSVSARCRPPTPCTRRLAGADGSCCDFALLLAVSRRLGAGAAAATSEGEASYCDFALGVWRTTGEGSCCDIAVRVRLRLASPPPDDGLTLSSRSIEGPAAAAAPSGSRGILSRVGFLWSRENSLINAGCSTDCPEPLVLFAYQD